MARRAEITRDTNETQIRMTLNLDGTGQAEIHTGIGFFDHMLHGFARHGLFDLQVSVEGDLEVDTHHTIEDTGIVLGKAIREAVGDKKGIVRYGSKILPMDEALILCALDLCGRPYLVYDLTLDREKVGDLETEMIREFFYAVSYGAEMNLHLKQLSGINNHHIIEAAFKAFAKSLDEATRYDERITDVLSTKGSL
ncbi:MAG: imidazoleglycerol-phosphate dehydratase HisB [Hungatella hathewayi]|nr:imidazoleglycerol-phosphate dehydratase HisB [Hungatella hathewayi]